MNPFENAPEFIGRDNRTRRSFSPVSMEQTLHKHQALLPADTLSGRTVLDLGCGLGATGRWALANGAESYTGVEAQAEYADTARELLEHYHPGRAEVITSPLSSFFTRDNRSFDIVVALGVMHAHHDLYAFLRALCDRTKATIAIEDIMPRISHSVPDFNGVEFSSEEGTNRADTDASIRGRGARTTPNGLSFMLAGFGFVSDGPLSVAPITDAVDNFNAPLHPSNRRYAMRFERGGPTAKSVADDLAAGDLSRSFTWKKL